ncbi:MAG: DNA repair protein RadA [Clostridia bacterium]|nr:DNA repair protein RadA [Clostridia bacterium]
MAAKATNKAKTVYVCSECGNESPKWAGQCAACGAWNSYFEEIQQPEKPLPAMVADPLKRATPKRLREISAENELRQTTGISELDRVLGGGIVKGSLILVSGEPGIGKSTILLQMCMKMRDMRILYVSGEESPRQIKLRADRVGEYPENLFILPETDIAAVVARTEEMVPDLLVVDSIQTKYREDMTSAPGSVPQVRECTSELMRLAKANEIPTFVVSHVNKEGAIAGPKVMEHMVDAVLYFEGERSSDHRILRAIKNRFGSTNEIGVFEMTDRGLREVTNPSELFLLDKPENVSGISTICVMEGTRPIIAEVQTLVSKTPFPSPRRTTVGFDYQRLNLILAVLERRCGLFFGTTDVYVNVIGGLRLDEPAADLGVAVAMVSAMKDFVIPEKTLFIGELGLAGEIRAVSGIEKRINEAASLGFTRCVIPARNRPKGNFPLEIIPAYSLKDVLNKL